MRSTARLIVEPGGIAGVKVWTVSVAVGTAGAVVLSAAVAEPPPNARPLLGLTNAVEVTCVVGATVAGWPRPYRAIRWLETFGLAQTMKVAPSPITTLLFPPKTKSTPGLVWSQSVLFVLAVPPMT